MPRGKYTTFRVTGVGGVNEQDDKADPQLELAQATNVWAPNGRLESRPGYVGLGIPVALIDAAAQTTPTSGAVATLDVSAASTPTVSTTTATLARDARGTGQSGDKFYVGHTNITDLLGLYGKIDDMFTTQNAANVRAECEYWNGSAWKPLNVVFVDSAIGTTSQSMFGKVNTDWWHFVPPQDWATVALASESPARYWLRFTFINDGDSQLTAGTAVNVANLRLSYATDLIRLFKGIFFVQTSTAKFFVSVFPVDALVQTGGTPWSITVFTSVDFNSDHHGPTFNTISFNENFVSTIAVVSEFGQCFLSVGSVTSEIRSIASGGVFAVEAKVDTSDAAIGPGAAYDKTVIASRSSFPQGALINFFDNRLWISGNQDEPYTIYWSAPTPYHKVWPVLQYATLMEDDNSPITGLAALGEHMCVFKRDSIWIMVDSGTDAFGLRQYTPKRVVAGVGCVAQGSIQQIRGNLIFLAEDGIYKFDGTPNIQKLSDPVSKTLNDMVISRALPHSAHWRTKACYLLSFDTNGDDKCDTCVVYDYKNGAWWVWDNMPAQFWCSAEEGNDLETLYFADFAGRVYQMGVGRTDHGAAITSTVVTHRLGQQSGQRLSLREINVLASNQSQYVTAEALKNDQTSGTNVELDFTDPNELDWEDFTSTGTNTWVPSKRRLAKMTLRDECDWFQVKLTHNEKYQPFHLSYIDALVVPMGGSS